MPGWADRWRHRVSHVDAGDGAERTTGLAEVGEVVATFANRIIVTDGDYVESESPNAVRAQLLEGVARTGAEAMVQEVPDRKAAIKKALSLARRGDTLVFCAVTTRPYRQVGAERLKWSDRNIINQLV